MASEMSDFFTAPPTENTIEWAKYQVILRRNLEKHYRSGLITKKFRRFYRQFGKQS